MESFQQNSCIWVFVIEDIGLQRKILALNGNPLFFSTIFQNSERLSKQFYVFYEKQAKTYLAKINAIKIFTQILEN